MMTPKQKADLLEFMSLPVDTRDYIRDLRALKGPQRLHLRDYGYIDGNYIILPKGIEWLAAYRKCPAKARKLDEKYGVEKDLGWI